MSFDQFHRENVKQAWRDWNPPKDLTKWESGACFIAFIRERYEAENNRAEQVDLFSNEDSTNG